MSHIDQELSELAAEFELLGDWEERYRYVIDLGRELAPLSDAERTDANKVRGCASQVWLVTEPQDDGTLRFRGDSDAHIVRGLIAVLLRLYSGRAPAEILAFDANAAFATLGLAGALLAVVVPILYLAVPIKDRGGYSTSAPMDRIAAHWVAVAAIVLLLLALYRALAGVKAERARRPSARTPAAARH